MKKSKKASADSPKFHEELVNAAVKNYMVSVAEYRKTESGAGITDEVCLAIEDMVRDRLDTFTDEVLKGLDEFGVSLIALDSVVRLAMLELTHGYPKFERLVDDNISKPKQMQSRDFISIYGRLLSNYIPETMTSRGAIAYSLRPLFTELAMLSDDRAEIYEKIRREYPQYFSRCDESEEWDRLENHFADGYLSAQNVVGELSVKEGPKKTGTIKMWLKTATVKQISMMSNVFGKCVMENGIFVWSDTSDDPAELELTVRNLMTVNFMMDIA